MNQRKDSLQPACKDFEASVVLYYYGDCEEPERGKVEGHLKGCILCSRFLEELRAFLPLMAKPKELPQTFWDNYYRELQEKLTAMDEAKPWWRRAFAFLGPWTVPALGTAAILILVSTFTLTKGIWRPPGRSAEEAAPREIRAVTKNLDFFQTMDLLESLDFLESLEETRAERRPV